MHLESRIASKFGVLFAQLDDGRIARIMLNRAEAIVDAMVGAGVDIISVNLGLRHLYVPSSAEGNVTVLGVGASGALSPSRALVALAVASVFCLVAASDLQRRALAADGITSLLSVANWRFILDHQPFGPAFGTSSPMRPAAHQFSEPRQDH